MSAGRFRTSTLVAALALAAVLASSCAYYNTFYLARKYYDRGTNGEPYPLEPASGAANQNFTKSIDYSRKVLGIYPTSKWVDDAYLLWARALLGKADPLQTVNMLEAFPGRFPNSPLEHDARFYLGVAYRHARRYGRSVAHLDTFLLRAPKHPLGPYAHLERARALASLERWDDAAAAASVVIERHSKSRLVTLARPARAEAFFRGGRYADARQDFRQMGLAARTDAERLDFLLREADCLEAAREYDAELDLLRDALSHEQPPIVTESSTPGQPPMVQQNPGYDRYGRIRLRMGTAHLLAGRLEPAIEAYEGTLLQYPRTPVGAEAQYRIGYAHETVGDDFERARTEYAKVREQSAASPFVVQAGARLQNLDRLAQFRGAAGADSAQQQVEAGFLLAELYLFQLEKPERALEEYRRIAEAHRGTPWEAKAMNAQAWVLSRRLDRPEAADSLFWTVVREHPATEAQLAARDYLEEGGHRVAADLIRLPEPPRPSRADTLRLARADSIATAARDSLVRLAARDSLARGAAVAGAAPDSLLRPIARAAADRDTLGRLGPRPGAAPARRFDSVRDSLLALVRRDSIPAGHSRADSLRLAAFRDSVRAAARAESLGIVRP